jgi:lipid II:glycine glycyltransferase (peptidoglycan interpeptide bridge formation enzyme)
LPFSDHCDPLADNPSDLAEIANTLKEESKRQKWDRVEFRPDSPLPGRIAGFQLHQPFYLHKLDLRPTLSRIFEKLSEDSIQRKIRRAERDALAYEDGTTESLIDRFYTLLCHTRRRHNLPPQPRKWFSNLFSSFRNQAIIRLASKEGKPVGALLTINFKDTLVYKYSCGEPEYFKHGTMQLLLWRAIKDAKASGMEELDFGRSDFGDDGLMLYKERWGAVRSETGYFRHYPLHPSSPPRRFHNLQSRLALPSFIPQGFLNTAGRLLYRHFG